MEEELEEASEEHPAKPVSIYKFGLWSAQQRFLLPECKGAIHATTADYNARAKLLIVGLTTGLFSLYEVPGFSLVHSLSIGTSDVSSCAINRSGDWLAFGCSQLGQLLVWEWQSETFVLKQQGHYYGISALEFSPDGSVIATGGDDGKVKLWSVMSGFCFVTFAEHTAAVTDICYVKGSHAIVSASLDGTVRAFDLVRYRNFRTLTTPTPVQFTCVTCDSSGDLIAAGTSAPFAIYIWSLRTGKLLDTLTGHEAPISCLQFNHRGTQLASGSWDHTVRTWDLLASGLKESLQHPAEILSLDWRRDDKELVASSLNGSVFIWNPEDATVLGSIDGRRDLSGGRRSTDEFTAQHNMQGKYFKSVCYSADGEFLIAAGQSKYVCIYSLRSKCLVRKYPLTQNLSLEGVLDKLNGKNMTEIGSKSELMEAMEDDGYAAPGVLKGDGAKRSARDEIYCNAVRFSPTGEMWAAASSQGLMVYSLDPSLAFDPFDLTEDVTPDAIRYALAGEEWAKALIYALHLNEEELIRQVLQSIPFDQIHPVCLEIPRLFLARLLSLLCAQANETAYVEYYLTWILHVLKIHGEYLRGNLRRYLPALRNVQKCLLEHYNRCKTTADSNLYTLRFLSEK
ncbi:hypothetical protein BLSTO_05046 [Blastocystis sp. subtype 1]